MLAVAIEGCSPADEHVRRTIRERVGREALAMFIRRTLHIVPVFWYAVPIGNMPAGQLGYIAGVGGDFERSLDLFVVGRKIRVRDWPPEAFVQPFAFSKILRRKARHRAGPVVGESSRRKLDIALGSRITRHRMLSLLLQWWCSPVKILAAKRTSRPCWKPDPASNMVTGIPFCESSRAAAAPAGPLPITTTWRSSGILDSILAVKRERAKRNAE
jgi:hypothetical protein